MGFAVLYFGALLAAFLVRGGLGLTVFRRMRPGYARALATNVCSGVVVICIAAFAMANGGPLAWGGAAAYCVPAQLVWLGFDFFRIWRRGLVAGREDTWLDTP